ncbi:hypothetical protein [Emticicia oligotrophica]|uniref:hypothetical protein n=1 Tax=Emticicia oligotrophica TaxID=312279 RepID=UPI00273BF2CC|nr:hypothetical protein [Emticicia oligotrophica]
MSSSENVSNQSRLNSLQISILRLFSQDLEEQQTLEIRKMLLDYFDLQLQKELEVVIEEKGYTTEDYYQMLNSKS